MPGLAQRSSASQGLAQSTLSVLGTSSSTIRGRLGLHTGVLWTMDQGRTSCALRGLVMRGLSRKSVLRGQCPREDLVGGWPLWFCEGVAVPSSRLLSRATYIFCLVLYESWELWSCRPTSVFENGSGPWTWFCPESCPLALITERWRQTGRLENVEDSPLWNHSSREKGKHKTKPANKK